MQVKLLRIIEYYTQLMVWTHLCYVQLTFMTEANFFTLVCVINIQYFWVLLLLNLPPLAGGGRYKFLFMDWLSPIHGP